jgi:hypothetical protein
MSNIMKSKSITTKTKVASEVNQDGRAECISESHLQFMRDFIEREEVASRKTLDLFLAGKLRRAMDSKPA